MLNRDLRIARVQKTLRWLSEDVPLLNMRVRELSLERQESAKQFAAALIDQTRAELQRLVQQDPVERTDPNEIPCEPAD